MFSIVHIDTGRELRGGQRQLLLLADGIRKQGHEQVIVCPEGRALEGRARADGFRVFALPPHDLGHAHGILQLRQLLLSEPWQILHAHDGRAQTLAWLASLGLPVRRVASRRVTFLPETRARHRFIYGRTCHAVIAISDFIKELLVQSGVPARKIEVIPDGVETPAELPSAEGRSRARRQWGFGEQEFVVGHVGSFTKEKGQDVALAAFALVQEKLPQARLLLAGDGPLRAALEERARAAPAHASIRLPGHVESLPEFFAALDLYIMPSRAEGLGSSALLAMAHGLPVVASRAGGLPEIVIDSETGWLVPTDSPQPLAEGIVSAASDGARLRQFAAAGRERARQFSSDIMRERTEALYRRLVL
ncbi:MAG: glycosyltransferase family 4 protein [Acidobacteria bacterium]|nr:glycosyltransferase family 4 protein [Acidobacteriota bacterium]